MIPLPAYLAQQTTNLVAGYTDFMLELAAFLGYGVEPGEWTSSQRAEMARDIQEAYRWCLYPKTIPNDKIPHVWSFLEQTTTLTTAADDYDYTLPADFGSFVGQYMFWPEGSGYDPPYRTNESDILFRRQHRSTTGRPQMFAIRWKSRTSGLSQRQEVLLFPEPDDAYTLTYTYAVLTGKLSTTNPYPLGGPRMAQLVMEACKAIGEAKKNGQRGDQWAIFLESLMSAIQMDSGTNTPRTVGVMRGAGLNLGSLQSKRPTTSYYYGPWVSANNLVDGQYTLES